MNKNPSKDFSLSGMTESIASISLEKRFSKFPMGVCSKKTIGDLATFLSNCRNSLCDANTPPRRTAAVEANLPRAAI